MEQNPAVRDIRIERGNGVFRTMYTVKDLAEILVYGFPEQGRGDAYMIALKACLECLGGGDLTAEDVRSAFVAAAHEVDLFILPDDAPR